MALLEASGIGKNFGETKVLKDISLTLEQGEALAIIGSSGSGKTTLLRCLNFLERPDTGVIKVNGETMWDAADPATQRESEVRKKRLHFGLVFQNFNLFPQYTALENVMLAGELLAKEQPDYKANKKAIHAQLEAQARDLLAQMGLSERAGHYPHQLSGGQQQRVGIARAFAANPPIVLMDEPFSALDPMTRAELQNEIHDLQTKAQKTVVFVTHDMDEAIKLADRICIIQDGKVAQCDTPENILKHPANQYVTEFIGANRLWANPEYIRAADIMRRRPFTISKGRTVIQALQIMRHNSVDSLLVLDKGQTLLGVVWLEELIGKREADPIEYYISDDYIAVEGETSLKEIIATIDYDVSGIIPVIQHDRKLLGYLTKSIILATMSKQFVPEHTAGERSGVICPATL